MSPYDPKLGCDDRPGAAAELFDQLGRLGTRERDEPSVGTTLHARQALAAHGVRDDDRRLAALQRHTREASLHVVEIVAVDASGRPAECRELGLDRFERHEIL